MNDNSIFILVALLPLAAVMLTVQVNPYHALVIRGILGAVAALVYAVLGAPDVALTEALVGTMLAITLYAVAVRSSLVMRFGVLQASLEDVEKPSKSERPDERSLSTLITALRTIASRHYLRLELVPYANPLALQQALLDKEIHATCLARSPEIPGKEPEEIPQPYHTVIRIRRLYDILQAELSPSVTSLAYTTTPDAGENP